MLEINGVGYRAEVQGNALNFTLGYSHPIRFPLPEGIKAEVERQVRITLKGTDKNLLGLTAAKIRAFAAPGALRGQRGLNMRKKSSTAKPGRRQSV